MNPFFTLINLSLFLFSLATTLIISPWPHSLFLFTFLSSFSLFLNNWLIPGGFAWRNHQNLSKLRGPFGWPVLGTLPNYMSSLAHRNLAAMATSYDAKKLMAFSLGATRVVISSHPETAKEILCNLCFSDRPIKEPARLLMFERAIGFAPYGTHWKNLRRIAAAHMFSPRRVLTLEPIRQRLANEMIVNLENQMKEYGFVGLRSILQKASLSNVIGSLFGESECLDMEEIGLLVKEGFDLIVKFNMEDYLPLKFLDFYGVKRRCYKLAKNVDEVVRKIVRERKEVGDVRARSDFLSVLLSLPKEEQLTESDMVAVLWEMIFRGTDTVAILLEWTMARMVMHQDIQEKAQQELDKHVGSNRHVQDSDIPNLRYLQSIIKEVLRLHPPGPLLSWARLATRDVHINKTLIPRGTTAMVNMWAITHDPSIWTDPWAFDPERFINNDVTIMGSDLRLAPFGSGTRVCPGKSLGLGTVHLWLARLLQHYKWLPAGSVELSECLRLSMEMQKPLVCHIVKR